jgi:RNA polymerase sigma-70 factor (ECF subfamily)
MLPASADTDERLLDDYVAGDDRALSRLVERYRTGVSRFVARQLGSRSAWAEDATQDVFIRVFRAAHRFEGRSTFKTWMFGIALNLCRDYLRRERHAMTDDSVLAVLPDASLDPLQRLEQDERAALVRAAVDQLMPAHRMVLRLRDGEDMSYKEIAEMLGVPVGTVRSRLHNARALLAKALIDTLAKRSAKR